MGVGVKEPGRKDRETVRVFPEIDKRNEVSSQWA